jgi:hypothetical protein
MANARRLELHEILCEILGNRNAYYDPPETVKMNYDAIRYKLSKIDARHANNSKYLSMRCYEAMLISRDPDPESLEKLLALSYTSMGTPYVADNLHHYPITIYY